MHGLVILGTVAVLSVRTPTAAAQESEARGIVEKAVQAVGGIDKHARSNGSYYKIKGVFPSDDPLFHFTFVCEAWSDGGSRFKNVMCGQDDHLGEIYTLVRNGANSWHSPSGHVQQLDEVKRKRLEKLAHPSKVCGLVTLLRDKGYTLTVVGDSTVKGAKVVGIKVQCPNYHDTFLYFDKNSGLLVKSAYRMADFSTGQEVLQEVFYSDYRALNPIALELRTLEARKQSADGAALLALLRARIPTGTECEEIARLVAKLGHVKFASRQKAMTELQRFGAKAAAQLREAAKSDDPEVARRAEQLLEALAKGQESAGQQTSGPEAPLVIAALRVLAMRRPAEAVETILAYLPWACDDLVGREALNALDALNEAEGKPHPALLEALKDPDALKRSAAAAVLGKDGGAYHKQPWRRLFIEGMVLAHHLTTYRDGKLYVDYEVTEYHLFNRFDDSVFARP
jgi:hypothetical protein